MPYENLHVLLFWSVATMKLCCFRFLQEVLLKMWQNVLFIFIIKCCKPNKKYKKLLSFNIWILIVKYTKETKIHLSREMSLSFLGPSDSRIIMTSFIVPHVCSLIVFAKSIEQPSLQIGTLYLYFNLRNPTLKSWIYL